jgi:septum formation protein
MLYLASNSPRRRQLMAVGGWDFTVISAPVDESILPRETPAGYVRRLAEAKARSAQIVLTEKYALKDAPGFSGWVVAADTTVADSHSDSPQGENFEILGKPLDAADARRMLRQLRGRVHQVLTGLAVLRLADSLLTSDVVVTEVPMRAYREAEIEAYIATGDPLDKAGAYAIQHPEFRPVQNLHGCAPNVVGLPVCRLAGLLTELGGPPGAAILEACRPSGGEPCEVYRRVTEMG